MTTPLIEACARAIRLAQQSAMELGEVDMGKLDRIAARAVIPLVIDVAAYVALKEAEVCGSDAADAWADGHDSASHNIFAAILALKPEAQS